MAKSSKQNYTLDTTKKIITATISELDPIEKEIVQMYINAGYILHKGKSNPWNKKSIMKWLEDHVSKAEAEKFEADCKDSSIGWVKARKQLFKDYNESKRTELENAKKEADKVKKEAKEKEAK